MTTTVHSSDPPLFTVRRSRLATLRDIALLAAWLAVVVSFLAQVWSTPLPAPLRNVTEPIAVAEGA
jgi:hypothetical protein